MVDVSSLYPQPPAPPAGGSALVDPLRAIGALETIRRIPLYPLMAQQLQTEVAQQKFNLMKAQTQFVQDGLASLANKPDVSLNDIDDLTVRYRRLGIPSHLVNIWKEHLAKTPDLKKALSTLNLVANGPERGAALSTYTGPSGVPATYPTGELQYKAQTAGGLPGPPPGTVEAATATGQAGAQHSVALAGEAGDVVNKRTQLDLMRKYARILGDKSGAIPGGELTGNKLFNRFLGTTLTLSPDEISAYEGYTKASAQMAATQANLHPTDKFLAAGESTVPGPALSRMGAEGLINVWHGNLDALERKNLEWQKALKEGRVRESDYLRWQAEFNQKFDPRVFQFMRMSKEQQKIWFEALPYDERVSLSSSLDAARDAGWIKSPR